MSSFTKRLEVADVVDAKTFARFCQQELGVPYPSGKEIAGLQRALKAFFRDNPKITYPMLCRVVGYAKNRRLRPSKAAVVPQLIGKAWGAGYLPELDARNEPDEQIERDIERALSIETDPERRRVLLCSRGNDTRREVLAAWQRQRQSQTA